MKRNEAQVRLALLIEQAIAEAEARQVPPGEFRYADVASALFETEDILEVLIDATAMSRVLRTAWKTRLVEDLDAHEGFDPDGVAA